MLLLRLVLVPADNFITSYLPHKYHLSMQLDSPANAASDFHEAAQHVQKQQQPSSKASKAAGPQKQQQQGGSAKGSKSRPLENETWWRMYCAGDVLACHLATAMEQGLNLQVLRALQSASLSVQCCPSWPKGVLPAAKLDRQSCTMQIPACSRPLRAVLCCVLLCRTLCTTC